MLTDIPTIMEERGDCEDTAYLMASVLEAIDVDTLLVSLPGHMATAVRCSDCSGTYYNYKGSKYFFLETTGYGWKIGQIPEDYKDVSVKLIEVN